MTTKAKSFEEANIECAQRFLQNVVVVDNQLHFEGEERLEPSAKKVIAPTPGPFKADPPNNDQETEKNEQEYWDQRKLNAKVLVEAFADLGITCCPYRPDDEEDEEVVKRASKIAQNADIVVLDWSLGETGNARAVQILQKILDHDAETGGRLRLIAIYTGDPNVFEIINSVRGSVFGLEILPEDMIVDEDDDDPFTVTNGQATVVFVNKDTVDNRLIGIKAISPVQLPDYLVSQFAKLTDGLMPNVVLASIAAIREATHHILAKFDNQLDSAILTHRALLKNPEDAEEFSVNLVGDEIGSILSASEIGAKELDLGQIRLWLKDRKTKGLKFGFDDPENENWRIEAPLFLLREGSGGAAKFVERYFRSDGSKYDGNQVPPKIPYLFSTDQDAAITAHLKLSRRNLMGIEAADRPFIADKWKPMLRLGTILHRDGDEFDKLLICVRPLCDCIRLRSSTRFDWLTLQRQPNKNKFQFVVMLPSGDQAYFSAVYSDKSDNVRSYKFIPKKRKDRIYAEREGEDFFFRARGGRKFQWIGYMKNPFANRELQELTRVRSRQGVDEYEWLRKKAQKALK